MPSTVEWILINCIDLDAMTNFWCGALDLEHVSDGPSGGRMLVASDGSNRQLGLMPATSDKSGPNRVHFDLRPDTDQLSEVKRLEHLGATQIDIGQSHTTWIVMADPEGNEFCVLRSIAEKTAAADSLKDRDTEPNPIENRGLTNGQPDSASR